MIFICSFFTLSALAGEWCFIGFKDETIRAVAVHPQNPDIIFVSGNNLYKSSDGGINWDTVAFFSSFNSIIFHPDYPDTMYATYGCGSYSDGIYKSPDGGNNWAVLECLYLPTSLTIPGYPPGTLVAGTKGMGVYESSDYGNTWAQINDSLDNLNVLSLIHINPCDCDSGQVYFAGTEGGIFYYYYDTGGPWYNTNTATNCTAPSIATYENASSTLWAALDGGSWSDGMYKSINFGITWEVSEYWAYITDILINPLNSQTIYAADSSQGVKITRNEGTSWEFMNNNLGDSIVYCLAQSAADTLHLYAGTSHGLYVYDFNTGIEETVNTNNDFDIKIYPNPQDGLFNLEIENISNNKLLVEIENINLQVIFNKRFTNTANRIVEEIDLSGYSKGIYFVKVYFRDTMKVEKVIIQ